MIRNRVIRLLVVLSCLFVLSTSTAHALRLRHDISPVFNYTQIQTTDRTRYKFMSPGINYYTLIGEHTGPFLSGTLFFPVYGSDAAYNWDSQTQGETDWTYLWDYYNRPLGFDVLVGLGTNAPSRFKLNLKYADHMEMSAGIGLHLNGIFLRNSQYDNRYFNSLTFGLGIDLRSALLVRRNFYLGLLFNGNFDFLDLIHSTNKMEMFFNFNTGIVLGFRAGSDEKK